MAVMFELPLDIKKVPRYSSGHCVKYARFIQDLRSRLVIGKQKLGPPEEEEEEEEEIPNKFFDILLETDDHKMRFRFRGDDFYLAGYQEEKEEEEEGTTITSSQWQELTTKTVHSHRQLITGSAPVGFGGSYRSLVGAGGINLGHVRISHEELANAVDTLSTTMNRKDKARSLLVVIIMLSEAIRHNDIEFFVISKYSGAGTPLNNSNGALELLMCGSSPTSLTKPCPPPEPALRGRRLMEVFSVCIDHRETIITLYGSIWIGAFGEAVIYKRGKNDSEHLIPGGYCMLRPESQCVVASDFCGIQLELRSWAGPSVSDIITWNIHKKGEGILDTLVSKTVWGSGGVSATVSYKVLKNAVQATVALVLVKSGEAASNACIHGGVTAYNGDSPDDQRIIFRRSCEDPIEVQVGREITLLRSVMAVPLGTSLVVLAALNDCKPSKHLRVSDSDSCYQASIADNSATFDAKLCGSEEQDIVFDAKLSGSEEQYVVFGANLSGSEEQAIVQGDSTIQVRVTWCGDLI